MKLNSIQFLRAVAAILVVYVHSIDLQMGYAVSRQQNLYYLQNFGAIGVDLFFVISGFIIAFVANNYMGYKKAKDFLKKRFTRINPIYYIASLLFWGVLIAESQPGISLNSIINSFIDTMFILPTSGDLHLYKPLLIIGWSLAFEWLFYILFFILILLKTKHKAQLMTVLIGSLVTISYLFKINDFRYVFITNPIMLEFLLGVAICGIYLNVKKMPSWLPIVGIVLGLTSYLLLIIFGFGALSELGTILTGQLSFKRFWMWGLPSALIAFGCIFLEKDEKLTHVWSNKLILIVGDASYSIYLTHLTAFSLFSLLYKKIGFFMNADLAILVQTTFAILVAIGFYKLVEKPLLLATQSQTRLMHSSKKTPITPPTTTAVP